MLFEFCVIHTRERECLLFSFSAQLSDPLLVEHCTVWPLVWLSNTLITLNTYSRLISHINTLQSSPPAVKTYFPSYEHTKLDTYEKETKNSNKNKCSYCSHSCFKVTSVLLPRLNICLLVCELLPQSTLKWQGCSHPDILVSRSY